MRALVVFAALAGCYDPHPADGVQCAEGGGCPSGQTCVGNVCLTQTDNMHDATVTHDGHVTADDMDGDGIADSIDNCPTVPNPDQANEDGDKFGDACDPCPIEANNNPSDPDGDGVADSCDPHPNVAGDKIVVFEGFANGVPTSWTTVGTISTTPGSVSITTVANNHSAIVPPTMALSNATLSVGMIVDEQVGTLDAAATIAMPYDPNTDNGIFCELYAPMATSPNNREIDLYDSLITTNGVLSTNGFAWQLATLYRVSLNRNQNKYTCSVDDGNGNVKSTGSSTSTLPAAFLPTFAVYGTNATAQWFMVVSSP